LSDAHKGLVSAIRRSFTNASLAEMPGPFFKKHLQFNPKKEIQNRLGEAVKAIFKFTDIELARTAKNALVGEYN